jgi:prepilin-type processing-associated H-X9-DG protein
LNCWWSSPSLQFWRRCLLPSLSRAKENARCIQCLSNQRQITIGYKAALDDDNGQLGWGTYYSNFQFQFNNMSSKVGWFAKTWGLANQGWICPDAPQMPIKAGFAPNGDGPVYVGTIDSAWQTGSIYNSWWGSFVATYNYTTNRAGSYAANNWVAQWEWDKNFEADYPQWVWNKEDQISHPSKTPMFSDSVDFWELMPVETDLPAVNLQTGDGPEDSLGMCNLTIPRHGSRPSHVTTNQPPTSRLPGAINISYIDGHAALVPLEQLWQQEWHRDWQTPAKRPGLNPTPSE